MADPVMYVTTLRIKEGRAAEYTRFFTELLQIVRENNPRMLGFYLFASEDGSEMTSVQLHPDTTSMNRHMELLAERMSVLPEDMTRVLQFLEVVRVESLGTPGERAAAMDKQLIEAGVPFSLKPRYVGGFTRSAATSGSAGSSTGGRTGRAASRLSAR